MKKTLALFLTAVLLLMCASALADTSTVRPDNGFYVNFNGTTGVERHVLTLKASEAYYIAEVIAGGSVRVQIQREGSATALYDSTDTESVNQVVTIDQDGAYQLTITGEGATASVWIRQRLLEETGSTMPERRELISSPLGYYAEINPDIFDYTNHGSYDVYTVLTGDDPLLPAQSMLVETLTGPAEGLVDDWSARLLAEPDDGMVIALAPMTAGERAVYAYRWVGVGPLEGYVEDVYFIALTADTTLCVTARYNIPDGEGIGVRMQQMLLGMMFS